MIEISKSLYLINVKIIYLIVSLFVRTEKQKILFVSEFNHTLDSFDKNISDLVYKKKEMNPKKTKLIKQIIEIKKAKYIFCDNYYVLLGAINTKNKIVIQCWHAGGAIKKIGFSSMENKNKSKRAQKRFQKVYDSANFYVCASEHMKKTFMESFRQPESKMLLSGYPKIDLYQKEEYLNYIEEIRKNSEKTFTKLNILYLPTFRQNEEDNIEQIVFLEKLSKELSREFNIFYKLHDKVKNSKKIKVKLKECENIIEINSGEIEYYYYFTDLLITDYSSVIFEYNLYNSNVLLYTYDYEKYKTNPGFNIDFNMFEKNMYENSEYIIKKIKSHEKIEQLDMQTRKEYQFYKKNSIARTVFKEIINLQKDNTNVVDYKKYEMK